MHKIDITSNEANQRLDRFLRKYLKDVSLSDIYKMLRKKTVKVNGKKAPENYRLEEGDILEIYLEGGRGEAKEVKRAGRDFKVVYEDMNILLADKPAELILHPDAKYKENTLVDQVLYYLYEKGEYNPKDEKTFSPAAVNRLDLNTGGIVIFAKNYSALQSLNQMVKERYIDKYYLCVVKGIMEGEKEVKAYLTKDEDKNIVKIREDETAGSREIHTKFRAVKSAGGYSLVEVNLITGRSHQIRAQLASIGHPIIGDIKYGDKETNRHFKKEFGLSVQFLYAYKLVFRSTTGDMDYLKDKVFCSSLPGKYKNIVNSLFNIDMEGC